MCERGGGGGKSKTDTCHFLCQERDVYTVIGKKKLPLGMTYRGVVCCGIFRVFNQSSE